ncbi:SSI family serine proteinase inhibitor [Actinopolymorpha sp. B17G11]|uniref:SSI family serine proteinase inhibitor n=1 Tax=Actinopolymorpha sp. B17G11 TaxID=3160861 RepID=UPI0032E52FC7
MSTASTARTRLRITVWANPDVPPRTWELTEDPPGGTHPRPDAAISAIEAAKHPFAPVPADAMCTQIYGGPARATVEGTWRGQRVSASYDKRNGCEIARWKALSAVLDA